MSATGESLARSPGGEDLLPRPPGHPRPRRDRILVALLLALAAVQLLTLPRFPYPGDNVVARAESVNLVQHGRLGFPLSRPFGGFTLERGQYLFENDAKGLMYSKYGFGHTLLYVPVVVAARALEGRPLEPLAGSAALVHLQNVYGVLFAVGCALYLYRLAALFTASAGLRVAFVVGSIYPSYAWHYLRAPTLEVFQIFFFLAFALHALRWRRAAAAGGRATGHLALATAAAGVLLLLRPTFGILLPLVAFLAVATGPEPTLAARVRAAFRERLRELLLGVALPGLALGGTWLAVNAIRTGSPLDAGYAQWLGPDGLPVARFTLGVVPEALRGFLAEAGNYNVFLHHPLLLLGLAGWPLLLRRRPGDARVLLACGLVTALPILAVSNWQAEWCYGPRYLVHAALVLSLPALALAERLRAAPALLRGAAAAAALTALALSTALQVRMNGHHYFAYQYAQHWFGERLAHPAAAAWFEAPRLRPVAVGQLAAFVREGAPFPPVDLALGDPASPAAIGERDGLRRGAAHLVAPNWGIRDLGRFLSARLRGVRGSPAGR